MPFFRPVVVTGVTEGGSIHRRRGAGTRVRFGMNAPTPWPPEVPAGENPPPGAILDYYLASDAAGPVKLEILDTAGRVVRTYSSTDPVPAVHPALDPVAYNKVCHETHAADHAASRSARHDITSGPGHARVPHGRDVQRRPRGACDLCQARALVTQLDALPGDEVAKFKAAVEALAPAAAGGGGGRGGGPGGGRGGGGRDGAAAAATLPSVSSAMLSAAMEMQGAEVAPTAREVAACATARTQSAAVMARWTKLTTIDLAALNAKRKAAGQPVVVIPKR
jgi:hypothetical protein